MEAFAVDNRPGGKRHEQRLGNGPVSFVVGSKGVQHVPERALLFHDPDGFLLAGGI